MTTNNKAGILIPMKQKWSELIYSGNKGTEIRKTLLPLGVTNLVVFATSGLASITGYNWIYSFSAFYPPICPGDRDLADAAISRKDYESYAEGKPTYFYRLTEVHQLVDPVHLSEMGISRTPQNFMYLSDELVRDLLLRPSHPRIFYNYY